VATIDTNDPYEAAAIRLKRTLAELSETGLRKTGGGARRSFPKET
jgi:hypothetical protein